MPGPYVDMFYQGRDDRTRSSARIVISLLLELVEVRSVIDVGCGVGTWLSVFRDRGVDDIHGIEGEWLDKGNLVIPRESFRHLDFARQPLRLDRTFDLAVSLEVAEHLPAERADGFVDSLVQLAPLVLFSAAVPAQGGVGHVNEQWPAYWAERFKTKGYEVVDCIRRKVWWNDRVLWWYAQNILLFVRGDYLSAHPRLNHEYERTDSRQLAIVHPANYLIKCRDLLKLGGTFR